MEAGPRQRLLDAADTLMYEHGYEAVGVAQLCQVADTRKGSFYHFFDSKQALALEMIDRSWERTRATIFAAALENTDLTTVEAIEAYGKALVDNLWLRQSADQAIGGCRFGNFAVELSARDEDIRLRIVTIFEEMVALMSDVIERGILQGELAADTDPQGAARTIIAYMQGLMVLAKAQRNPDLLAELGDFARLILER